jgi:hypothetical protein
VNRLRSDRGEVGVGAAVLLGIAAIVAIVLLVYGIRWITAEPSGKLQQRESTVGNGDYRISAYDKFFDDCSGAKTTQQNLKDAKEAADAHDVDATRQAQLDANVTALKQTLYTLVNQYNADAMKADTRGHFKASNLPYQIELDSTDPTKKEITCSAS